MSHSNTEAGNEKAASIDIPDSSPSPISSSLPNASPALSAEVVARLRALEDATEPSLVSQIFTSFLSDGAERIRGFETLPGWERRPALRKTAHALRGASANIGAQHMADIAQQLETLGKSDSMTGAVALIEEIEAEFERIKAEITELSILIAPPSHIAEL